MKARANNNGQTLENKIAVDIQQATKEVSRLESSLAGLKRTINNISKNSNILNTEKQINNAKKATDMWANSWSGIKKAINFSAILVGGQQTLSILKDMTNESVNYAETVNLFNASFGKGIDGLNQYYEQAISFQERLEEKLGVNIAESMKYQALFNSMTKSMGLTANYAYTLSENFTKLGYDLASLYNIDTEEAMRKLRAGLAGETEPLRAIGLDITEQSLQPTLDSLGIEKSLRTMSQAEKSILRYITVLRQAQIAQGDFANTMDSPANQLRIFNAQVTAFKRNMGNLWQGLLGSILPYVNAIVMVINELLKMIAKLFGFEVYNQPVNISAAVGAGDLADDFGTASDNLGEAGKKAKELKNQLMGFDEINNITLNNDTSSGGGGGSSAGGSSVGGIDKRLLDALTGYDNLMDSISNKAADIRDKIMRWLGFTQELNSETGELEWKLREDIYPNILKIRDGAIAIGTALLGWKISRISKNILDLVGSFGKAGKKGSGFLGVVSALGTKLGVSGGLAAGLGAAAGGALLLGGYFAYNYTESSNFRQGISTLKDSLVGLTQYIYNEAKEELNEFSNMLKNLVPEPIRNSIETLKNAFKELKEELQINDMDLAMANIPLLGIIGKLHIALKALGYLNKPIVEDFVLLNEEMVETGQISEETANKLTPMLSGFENIDNRLKSLDYSKMAPSQADVDSIKNNMATIVKTVGSEIETNKQNAMNSINELFSNSGITDKEKQEMLESVESMYEEQNTRVKDLEQQTNSILENAKNERRPLREDETKIVEENQRQMKEITIRELSETEEEFNNIQARITATARQQSTLQASEIIKQAIKTRDDTKTEAEKRYQEQIEIANQLKERGTTEAIEMADKIIAEAERQKEETNSKADESFENLIATYEEKNPEILRLVDTNTGEIKSRFDVLKESVSQSWTTMWTNIKTTAEDKWNQLVTFFTESLPKWWNENIAPWFTKEKWQELGENMKNGITAKWQEFETWWKDTAIVQWWNNNVSPWFTKEKWQDTVNNAKMGIESKFNEWKNNFNPISDWWNNKVKPWFTWEKWHQLGQDAISSIQSAFSNFNFKIKLPHFKWENNGTPAPDWARGILEALNLPTTLPKLNVSWYATGGLPSVGELFVAREAGPELVGTMGSKTAVANNDQIVEGIKQGVYEAVTSAMSQQSNRASRVEIVADKEGIFKVVRQEAKEFVMQTGEEPFPSVGY